MTQTREILAYLGEREALLAGDFNAEPDTPKLEALRAPRRFTGLAVEAPTFPASAPTRRIDQVLAPADWTLVLQHVVDTGASDRLAVVATFALPPRSTGRYAGRSSARSQARPAATLAPDATTWRNGHLLR